ncbi:hypothetical protein DEU50_12622 [Aeromonas salmonicida]|uniref:Uncharacterized protein n=1 Tax=Aeromonas salmonicida TaxID=645 RepID=A0AAX1PD48_AERSA|nr:hypothetical protein DEU50_12622 [Aeromonas salmonicida]
MDSPLKVLYMIECYGVAEYHGTVDFIFVKKAGCVRPK